MGKQKNEQKIALSKSNFYIVASRGFAVLLLNNAGWKFISLCECLVQVVIDLAKRPHNIRLYLGEVSSPEAVNPWMC